MVWARSAAAAATAVGVTARDAGLSRRHLRRALDASLARLGVDHIDLYQLHAWDPLTSIQPQYSLLTREVEWEILPASQAAGLAVLA